MLYGRAFFGDGALAAQCVTWLQAEAIARVHVTTRRVLAVVFATEEQECLLPLAARARRSFVMSPSSAASPTPTSARSRGAASVVERRSLHTHATAAGALLEEIV